MIQFLTKPILPKCGLNDDEIDQAKRRDSMNETSCLCSLYDNRPSQRRLSTHIHYDSNNKAFNKTPPNSNSIQLTIRFLITSIVLCVFMIVAASTIVERPSDGKATIVPGQPLHFECKMVGNKDADYIWYYRTPNGSDEKIIEPNNDDLIEIHNTRLTLHKPTSQSAGDYICRALNSDKSPSASEFAIVRARVQPYIEEFNIEKSHTGKSAVVTDGDRLELICTVADKTFPVNITWLRSTTPDDDRDMRPLPEYDANSTNSYNQGKVLSSMPDPQLDQLDTMGTYTAPGDIIVEALNPHSKRLVIESVKLEHRSYYACVADNGVSSQRMIFIRVKDRMVALWPFLGIVAELFILFTIIYVWETQRAYKTMQSSGSGNSTTKASPSPTASNKRPASGATVGMESVPLTSG